MRKAVCDTADLKQRLIKTWLNISQTVMDKATDKWGLRLRACVKAKGRHFKHSLQPTGSFQSHPHFIEVL